jgi:CRISPR system Cascade subunit CasB
VTTEAAPKSRTDGYDAFVQYVSKVCAENPGQRSALRLGLGRPPEQAYTVHATVARWLPDGTRRAKEWALYAVASMIAAQPRSARQDPAEEDPTGEPTLGELPEQPAPQTSPKRRPSLGLAMGRAVTQTNRERRAMGQATAEKRLHLLTRQDLAGIHQHLPGAVQHIRTLGVPIDWTQLILDLGDWSFKRDQVAKRWLQDFYRTLPTTKE